MNGYKIHADAYRKVLADENPTGEAKAEMERRITALDIMANTDRPTQFEIFNTGGFNDVCKGYLLMALRNIGVDPDTQKAALAELRALFDTVTAGAAEQFYTER